MVTRFLKHFCKCEKKPQNAKLYNFEKIPKEINDIHISMAVSLITLRKICVNMNELHVLTPP